MGAPRDVPDYGRESASLPPEVTDYYRKRSTDGERTSPSGAGLISVQLPQSGPGFVAAPGTSRKRQFALSETIEAIKVVGQAWVASHPDGPRIVIREMSKAGGGTLPPHRSHDKGLDVDIQYVRNDTREARVRCCAHGKESENADKASYSRERTQELINVIRNNGILKVQYVFSKDRKLSGANYEMNHYRHMHVRFLPPD